MDLNAFRNTELSQRTETIKVPELGAFFAEGEEPAWTVRALSANEIFKADGAKMAQSRASALAEAITSGSRDEIIKEVQAALGQSGDVQPETARRLEMLVCGSVDPVVTIQDSVRLAENFPTVFIKLTNVILTLSGRGADAKKKPTTSGAIPASKPPSP